MLTFLQLCEVATIKNKRLTKNKITMKENISNEELEIFFKVTEKIKSNIMNM